MYNANSSISIPQIYQDTFTKKSHLQAIIVTSSLNLFLLFILILLCGKPFLYPLDDTYIHMSIAKTLAETGIWGLTPQDPASASSSPLFTVLMALIYTILKMVNASKLYVYSPLAINIASMILLSVVCTAILATTVQTSRNILSSLLLLSLAIPLPVIILIGMEHSLHIALSAAFLLCAARSATAASLTRADHLRIFILSALVVATRYESLLLIAPIFAYAAWHKRWQLCAALSLGALLPIVAFGLIWVWHDGWLLPNTLLLKQKLHGVGTPQGKRAAKALAITLAFPLLAVVGAVLAPRLRHSRLASLFAADQTLSFTDWRLLFLATAFFASVAHIATGAVGWLYRYEAAVLTLDILGFLLILQRYYTKTVFTVGFLLCLAWQPYRSWDAAQLAFSAPADRRWEHQSVADFINQSYSHDALLLNDIGLASWVSPSARILDIVGLANNQIARQRLSPEGMSPEWLSHWATEQKAPVAVLQLCWQTLWPSIPADWTLVSVWKGPQNAVFGDVFVGFFATSPAEVPSLEKALAQFSLPAEVQALTRQTAPQNSFFGGPQTPSEQSGCYHPASAP